MARPVVLGSLAMLTLPLVSACASCSKSTPKSAPAGADGATQAQAEAAAEAEQASIGQELCEAGALPRFTESNLLGSDRDAFLARAERGTVAVILDQGSVSLLPKCILEGRYYTVEGEKKRATFGMNGRIVFRSDETAAASCRAATHMVATYAVPVDRSGTLRGILVPLPCPSIQETAPAAGCIGKGLSGPERVSRSHEERAQVIAADPQNVEALLRIWALAPDDADTLRFFGRGLPASLIDHASWFVSQYVVRVGEERPTLRDPEDRRESPTLHFLKPGMTAEEPAFRWCFADLDVPDVQREVLF